MSSETRDAQHHLVQAFTLAWQVLYPLRKRAHVFHWQLKLKLVEGPYLGGLLCAHSSWERHRAPLHKLWSVRKAVLENTPVLLALSQKGTRQ